MPKTGTSYLQSTFAFNEEHYKKHGLLYPDLSSDHQSASSGKVTSGNGLSFAKKIIPQLKEYKSDFNEKDFFSNLDPSYDYLISSEWLVTMTLKDINRINRLCGKSHHIHILVFYRSVVDQIVSHALQGIKHTFDEPLMQLIQKTEKGQRHLINYVFSLCKQYSSHSVLRYEETDHNLDKLDKIFFGSEHITKRIYLERVNLSPEMHQISVIELAHKLGISQFVQNTNYIDSTYNPECQKFGLSKADADGIEQSFNVEIAAINQLADSSNQYQRYKAHPLNKAYESIDINDKDVDYLKNLIKIYSLKQIQPLFDFLLEVYIDQLNDHDTSLQLPADFDPIKYLLLNPDLILARVNPKSHFIAYANKEGRLYK